MAMAVALGDCSRDDADLLRRAMGSKRGVERIESIQQTSSTPAWRGAGWWATAADAIYVKILSFANFGFAESHALSFALLVYASRRGSSCTTPRRSWPACCATSRWASTRRSRSWATPAGTGSRCAVPTCCARAPRPGSSRCGARRPRSSPPASTAAAEPHFARTEFSHGTPDPTLTHRRDGDLAVRMGLDSVRGIGLDVARADRRRARPGAVHRRHRPVAPRRAHASRRWRRWRRPVPSSRSASTAGRRSGRPVPPRAPTSWRAPPRPRPHPPLPGDDRGRAHPRRPVGHPGLARAAPGGAPARAAARVRHPLGG